MAEPPARSRDAAATRDQLAHAARALFATHGYEATTVSQIARAAGFSPNLITRYFGGKEGLFLAATKAKLDLDAVLVGGIDGFGQRLADQMVDGWEQGDGDPLLALLRSSRPAALLALGEFLEDQATAPLTRALTAWGCTETEASIEVIDLRTLVPFDIETLLASVRKTGRCVIVHEAPRTCGFGAELVASIQERAMEHLEAPILRVTGMDTPFPFSLEHEYLPNPERVLDAVRKTLEW